MSSLPAPLPFVTVVLPVLNGAGRLERALEGLNQQDYPRDRFEIIVADGRSTDATAQIAEAFGCRVVDNAGVTVAAGRNVGIRHARGELIAFSEDDIILPPHWLSSAVRLLSESGAGGVGGPTPIPQGSSLWSHAVNAVFRTASLQGASVQSDRAAAGAVDDLPGGNSLYSARALQTAGPIDERLTTAEDVAMHHELRQRGFELRLYAELAAEHHKRDSVAGFFRQMQRFAIGRVQLFRRWSGALSALHWLTAAAGPIGVALVLWSAADAAVLGSLALLAFLGAALVALRQGERPRVACVYPVALAVFLAGWSVGFWSELLLPSRDSRRVDLLQKLTDAVASEPIRGSRWRVLPLGGAFALQCVLFCLFSQRAPFIMDEFQQGGYARHIERGYYSALVPFKTVLFTYVYYLPRLWWERASDLLLIQRGETVMIVLATLGVLYCISRRIGRSRLEALMVVTATLCFSTFFEFGANLRAEPSALLLATVGLFAATLPSAGQARPWHYVASGVALAGAFFCTQKAVWFCVSVGLSVLARSWLEGATCRRSSRLGRCRMIASAGLWLLAGFTVVVLAYCFAFAPATPEQVFRGVFLRSSRFAVEGNTVYRDLDRFIWDSLGRNWWLYAISAAGMALSATRLSRAPQLLTCWLTAAAMTVFILTWKEPWPYVLTWWVPFLALFYPDAYRVARQSALSPRSPGWRRLVSAVALLAPVAFTLPRTAEALSWDNREQLALVDHVEALLAPEEAYQDGIGMVSTRELSGLVWWDAEAIARILAAPDQRRQLELEEAWEPPPKVLIMNYRLMNLLPVIRPFIMRSYAPVDRGLLIAGTVLSGGSEAQFEVRWEGRYALVEADGRRSSRAWVIDGAEAPGPRQISVGPHLVSAAGCAHCFLIPDDTVGKVTPAATFTRARVFDRPYTR